MESMEISPPAAPPLLPAGPPGGDSHRFSFHGEGGALFVLLLKNVLLTIVTLGIYAPWAKTARRKFVWSNIEIDGQRLAYTGTGQELFIAYLKLFGLYLLAGLVVGIGGSISEGVGALTRGVLALGTIVLIPYAIYWSRAYLYSRTLWRGIRFGMIAGADGYARAFLLGYLLSVLTLGIYGPFWATNLRRIATDNARFGSEPFRFDGVGKEVFWICFKGFLLTLVTLGIYWFWMQATLQRYFLQHTSFTGARGKLQITGGTLLGLFLLNLLGNSLTLGLAFPWISVYSLRTILDCLSFEGPIEFARIEQTALVAGAEGDVLANAFDVGLGI